ncbi:MAG: hypothetical protein ACYC35_28220 [Pirellulales bacterium]
MKKIRHRFNVVLFRGCQIEAIRPLRLGYNAALTWLENFERTKRPEQHAALLHYRRPAGARLHAPQLPAGERAS